MRASTVDYMSLPAVADWLELGLPKEDPLVTFLLPPLSFQYL